MEISGKRRIDTEKIPQRGTGIDRENFHHSTHVNFESPSNDKEQELNTFLEILDRTPDYLSKKIYRGVWDDEENEFVTQIAQNEFAGRVQNKIYDDNGELQVVIDNDGHRWERVGTTKRGKPLLAYDTGKVSSAYWYDDDGVYRLSNHWGKVGKSVWNDHYKDEIIYPNDWRFDDRQRNAYYDHREKVREITAKIRETFGYNNIPKDELRGMMLLFAPWQKFRDIKRDVIEVSENPGGYSDVAIDENLFVDEQFGVNKKDLIGIFRYFINKQAEEYLEKHKKYLPDAYNQNFI